MRFPASPAVRARCAAAVAILFYGLIALNLFVPTPNGPADNGDFVRIHGPFSAGPADSGPRFFKAYHRFWKMGGRVTRYPEPTSSAFIFLPGLVPGAISGRYDLALNAALVTGGLALVLFWALRRLRSPVAFCSLSAMFLLAADGNIAGYLDSFFQEAGALVFLLLLVAALHVLWDRRSAASFAAAVVFAALLSTAKIAYAFSIPLAAAPVVLGAIFLRPGMNRALPRLAAAIVFSASVLAAFLFVSAPKYQIANCYHFLFGAAVPELAPAERAGYLESLGIPGRFASLAGKNAYEPGNAIRDPGLRPHLTRATQAAAVRALLDAHPSAFFRLLSRSLHDAGVEPRLQEPGALCTVWSSVRSRVLPGPRAYLLSAALLAILLVRVRGGDPSGWPLFSLLISLGFLGASALQIAVSILGNGPFDILRHDFLANLLMDFELVALGCGLAATIPGRRAAKPAD